MKHNDLLGRGLKKVRSVLSTTNKTKSSVSAPDFELLNIDSDDESTTMGKSNKFDYTNRASGGAKLGGIIGRDVEKEADKVIKDVEKQITKTRKSSVGSSNSTIDHTDTVVHTLDITAPSKQLGDEGACAMAAGLEAALNKGTTAAAVLLEDLNLSDNGITTVTLGRLAPVITAARYTIKTLNLCDNDITVETDQQASEWETFLRSFGDCYKLRRLDLSGNLNLGSRALEIFARVHCKEPRVTPISVRGNASVQSLYHVDEESEPLRSASPDDQMANATVLTRRSGLRGIPYITLTNIGLTDAGALWLSYVLEEHHFPEQLTDLINAAPATSNIKTYAQGAGLEGLAWDATEASLGKDGLQLLKKTEAVRRQMLLDSGSIMSSSMFDSGELPRARAADRRASMRSITSADGGEHELTEVESLRKKLLRHIIAYTGAAKVELWRAALRMAISSTVLSGIGPIRYQVIYYKGPPLFDFASRSKHESRPMTPTRDGQSENQPISSTTGSVSPLPYSGGMRHGTYAQTLTSSTDAMPGEPELAITEVTNSPTTPKVIFKPHRKGAFSDGSDLQMVSRKLDELIVGGHSPQRFVHWQEDRIQAQGGEGTFRNRLVLSQFPEDVMDKIVECTVSEKEQKILTRKQRRAACAWGQDRGNFEKAESWRKLPDSSQVLSLLECIGCLAYQSE